MTGKGPMSIKKDDSADEAEKAKEVPPDRAGAEKGARADILSKYTTDDPIKITEIISNRQIAKDLYVANERKNPKTGKFEYQLKERKEDGDVFYSNGKWYTEKEVRRA